MSPATVRLLAVGVVLLTLLAAAPAGGGEKDVQVSVIVILASENDTKIDPKLKSIAREVSKTHKNLTGFRIGRMTRKPMALGTADKFDLVGDQAATITVQPGVEKKSRFQLKVAPPLMGEITYDTCCGKFLPICTPYRTKKNETLIIAVRVQPCKSK
jgi:hypothetical protein